MKFAKPRGTHDWYYERQKKFKTIVDVLTYVAEINGYSEIKTPIFESAELFIRSVGESTDIVQKEFYEFTDKNDRKLVLRPEGTAGVIRAVVEDKLTHKNTLPLRFHYNGPMFRYERPQSGRARQFHQFGVECIGTNSVYDDVDIVVFADSCLKSLGLANYSLKINNIGSSEGRSKWISDLRSYFEKYRSQLTEDSQARLNTNPLRILDDKIDGKKDFVISAPKIDNYLSDDEVKYFEKIIHCLKKLDIKFEVDNTLVRGLDYYSKLVFEFVSNEKELSGQSTILGGGRYSNLVAELGGEDVECVGFAIGIERILMAIDAAKIPLIPSKNINVVIAPLVEECCLTVVGLQTLLRVNGVSCVTNFQINKLPKHFNYAEKVGANFVIIIGENELKTRKFTIKNQKTLLQESVDIDDVVDYIKKGLN